MRQSPITAASGERPPRRLLRGTAQAIKKTELAAQALRVQLQYLYVKSPQEIESLIQAASGDRADAVLVLASRFLLSHRINLAELAAKARLPAIYYSTDFVEDGGPMSYG
jgi:ABC-type uncharacterized transport system substrate-binding protein